MAIPVYAFTGFLDSGKTKFIQETLEDERFNAGERTLLLVFEEGEEEYDFAMKPETLKLPEMNSFLRLLTGEEFKEELERLGGYTTEHTGEIIRIIPE